MARIRTIKPEFWSDDKVTSCSPLARLLFIGLWNFADDEGRMDDAPRQIKARVLPSDEATIQGVDALLGELAEAGLIERYGVAGRRYLRVRGWRHQKISHAAPSRIPPSSTEDVATDADATTDGTPLSLSLPLGGSAANCLMPAKPAGGGDAVSTSRPSPTSCGVATEFPPPLRGRDREGGDVAAAPDDSANAPNLSGGFREGSALKGREGSRKEGSGVEAPAYADLTPAEQGALLIAVGESRQVFIQASPTKWEWA